ncbi:beta-N-acetylhexosaminidase [Rhizobium paknamense]|uniref:beta-N-acetylhexosaminidase n=2 Tax=Rhizobium paknamense TaxID=1206817 RepID=A0ABU0IG16_9HYPH|nr:beta-N-acetylhexosaminidase [Rhizobium paknamense]
MILGCSGPVLTQDEIAFFRDHQPWGFIVFGRNCVDGAQIADLVAGLRDTVGGRNAPVLIDQEGGRVQRIREPMSPRYPSGAAIGDLYRRDRQKGQRAAWIMSRLHAFDLSRYGINVDCLPVLDVPVEGASNVIGDRAYGTDPLMVADLGEAAAAGLIAGGVLPVVKHIPGHGRGMADSHHELPVVSASREELHAHDLPPFKRMRHALMAMTAHVVYTAYDPDHTASTSKKVVEELIRNEIGFGGLLMNDDISMNALKGTIAERARAVIAAGNDVLLHCHGIMEEMAQVAAEAPELDGKSLERAKAVEAAFGKVDGENEQALREEFAGLMASA